MSNDTPEVTPSKRKSYELSTFVPAHPQKQELAPVQISSPSVVELLPQAAGTGHSRQDDDAITHAKATLLVSFAYIVAAAMITAGLLLLAWLFKALGRDWALYVYIGLIGWGVCVLASLWANRRQSLHHSPTGIGHHEIDSRERIAMHAINVHAELLLKRWGIDRDQ